MNEKERIEYIKKEWKKFLEKNSKRDIDISKIKSIDEVKQALKIREAIEYISEEFNVGLSDEQVVLLSDALIEKTVIDEKGEIKELKSREGKPYFFSQNVFLMITRLEFAVLVKELQRLDRPELLEAIEDLKEPDISIINKYLKKDGIRVENTNDYPSIRGYYLSDIINKGQS